MKPRACHTSMKRGAKVLAILRSGEQVVGKYVELKGRFVVLDVRRIQTQDLRSLTYYKPSPEHGPKT